MSATDLSFDAVRLRRPRPADPGPITEGFARLGPSVAFQPRPDDPAHRYCSSRAARQRRNLA